MFALFIFCLGVSLGVSVFGSFRSFGFHRRRSRGI